MTGDAVEPSKTLTGNALERSKTLTGDAVEPSKTLTGDALGRSKTLTGDALSPAPVAAKPALSSRRVKLAFATAVVADICQLPVNLSFFSWGLATLGGTVPLEAIDTGIDVITALVVNRLLGFHWALLPTFALELIPGLDAAPTWTACVAYVTMRRRRRV